MVVYFNKFSLLMLLKCFVLVVVKLEWLGSFSVINEIERIMVKSHV